MFAKSERLASNGIAEPHSSINFSYSEQRRLMRASGYVGCLPRDTFMLVDYTFVDVRTVTLHGRNAFGHRAISLFWVW
jgi:hypothetical protein